MAFSNSRRSAFYSEWQQIPVAFNVINIFNSTHTAPSSPSIFAPIIPILLNFLQIRTSATNPSPFELRPLTFIASVAFSVAYYFTIGAKFMFPAFASQFGVLMSVFGSLAVATFISLILQLPWWSIFFLLLLLGGFLKLLNKLHGIYGTVRPHPKPIRPLLPQ